MISTSAKVDIIPQDLLSTQNSTSDELQNRTRLVQMNDAMFVSLLPAVFYLLSLMVVGTVGNLLVIYIFGWKIKSTTQNYFFIWLAIFDLVSCVVGIPSEIVFLRRYNLYEDETACKIMRFLLALPPIASMNILLSIAIDRYRRVCKPLHVQMELTHAKICVVLSTIVGLIGAGPDLSLFGKRKITVGHMEGYDCSIQEKYSKTIYPVLREMMYWSAFVLYVIALSTMNIRIWLEMQRHQLYLARNAASPSIALSSCMHSEEDVLGKLKSKSPILCRKDERQGLREVKWRKTALGAQKMTVIALTVTIVFILSYLPHLCLSIPRAFIPEFEHMESGAALVLYNIFLRSYFVNSMANVFVYSAMNVEFKAQCKATLKSLFCAWRRMRVCTNSSDGGN